MRKLDVGNENFSSTIRAGSYFVDKSLWIKPLLESSGYVQIITRPRRFGKSMFLDMVCAFLRIDCEHPGDVSKQRELFSGLDILKEVDFCERFMGRFPVIALSFNGIEGGSFAEAYGLLGLMLAETARGFDCLLGSPRLNAQDKADLLRFRDDGFMMNPENKVLASRFISRLSVMLEKHFGAPVILLIDEYDVPLAKASSGGYYDEMRFFYKALLSVLKTRVGRQQSIRQAVMTGCLRISKESVFTGLNNLGVNTVCSVDDVFSGAIGFTPEEVEALLAYYGLESRRDVVRQWYDGYRLASSEIYCPWDVLMFCAESLRLKDPLSFRPVKFWADTSDNAILDDFLGFIDGEDADRMQALVDGGEITIKLNEQVTFSDLKAHRSEDFWTLLLFTGYLTVAGRENEAFRLKIPNEAVRDEFRERIQKRFTATNSDFSQSGRKFALAAVAGETNAMRQVLFDVLENYVSVRDSATKARAENFTTAFSRRSLRALARQSMLSGRTRRRETDTRTSFSRPLACR